MKPPTIPKLLQAFMYEIMYMGVYIYIVLTRIFLLLHGSHARQMCLRVFLDEDVPSSDRIAGRLS